MRIRGRAARQLRAPGPVGGRPRADRPSGRQPPCGWLAHPGVTGSAAPPGGCAASRSAASLRVARPSGCHRSAASAWRLGASGSGASSTVMRRLGDRPRRSSARRWRRRRGRRRAPTRRAGARGSWSVTTTGSTPALSDALGLGLGLADLAEHLGGRRRRPAGRRRRPRSRSSSASGHGARWTEPVLPPRPDLLGDEREERGEQPQQGRQRELQRGLGRPRRGSSPCDAVGPALDQLEVVVAELPEERLGALERPGVVVAVEGGGGVVDQLGQRRRAWPGRAAR